jgi:hypothetical protein
LGLVVDDQEMRQPVVIRTPLLLRMYVIGFMAFWVGAVFSFPIASPSDALLVTVMVAFGVAFASRMAMVKLQVDESGLLVRNLVRTWRFDRAEVEDFRLGRDAMGLPFGQVIHVLLRNGEVVTADASWASWGFLFGGRAKREEVLLRLREWLEPPR